jgi:Zn-dependent protease
MILTLKLFNYTRRDYITIMYSSSLDTEELYELLVSALVLAYAFYVASYRTLVVNPIAYLILLLIVILSFIPHELAHRYVAIRYGYIARYHMWLWGLLLAVLIAFTGIVFAAPGAVYIVPTEESSFEDAWKIALAGPLANVLVGIIFLVLAALANFSGALASLCLVVAQINIYLAFFNSLPIPPLDGSKVAFARPDVYIAWMIALIPLLFLSGVF